MSDRRIPDRRSWGDPAASAREDMAIMKGLSGWRAEANRIGGIAASFEMEPTEMTDIDQTAPDPSEYVLVRRDLIQRAIDEAIDCGRHYAIERDLRAALDPPTDKDAD